MTDPDDNPVPRSPEVRGAKFWLAEARRLLAEAKGKRWSA